MKAFCISIVVLSVALFSLSQTTPSLSGAKATMLPAGDWGGEHVRLSVTAEGADLEFDCASGHIRTPLVLDAHGKFSVKGKYRHERPAAAFVDDSEGSDVVYSGTVRGDTMHLKIEMPGQADNESFELTRGQEPRLTKCA